MEWSSSKLYSGEEIHSLRFKIIRIYTKVQDDGHTFGSTSSGRNQQSGRDWMQIGKFLFAAKELLGRGKSGIR